MTSRPQRKQLLIQGRICPETTYKAPTNSASTCTLRYTPLGAGSGSSKPAMARRLCFFLVFLVVSVHRAVASCSPSDRDALLALKSALDEPYIGVFSSWTGDDCCSHWYGVSCDPTNGRVADVTLRGEAEHPLVSGKAGFMSGQISPAVCRLDRLTTVVLADWRNISGPIPPCITSLPLLRILDLTGNRISGPIPDDIGKLSRLTVFNLADNQISGEIPPSLPGLASLMHLDLSNNRITEEIPGNFGDLRKLSRALLAGNQITGGIPGSIGSMNRLADLDLSGNRIRGTIPEGLGRMQVLSTLYLDGNQLSGEIPASLLSSRGISILNLSKNSLEGGIPDVFGDGSYFTALDLSYNRLRGSVPETLKTAKFVGHLDLSHNQLCGHIPQGEPFDHLEAASFSGNDCLCGGPLPRCLSHH